ncbi:histone-lysine N-methyltransferase PRDM9-like [Clarias magur]|uniref:Histone-lysine N-methyltransferase PRDM9-like n=1 Tax=Clarias magur TaxID=1594786 RepID=A0A8J4T5Y8_CLAMG|nr:histone-lysine N-methyltransferase PRDM9-like [Clarias magur]
MEVEGRNMQMNQDSCESNEHKELKMICVKEEEPDEDEYLFCLYLTKAHSDGV